MLTRQLRPLRQLVSVRQCSSNGSHLPVTSLTPDELMMKETVDKYANDVVGPLVKEMDDTNHMHQHVRDGLFANGFMGAEIPSLYDGPEATFMMVNLIVEGLARIDPSVSVFCDVQNTLVAPILMQWGSEQQKKDYLPRLHKDLVGAFGLSEAGSGSDAFALKTTATLDGDDYVINGTKMWITNAEHAGLFFVMATVDPSKGYKGITCFLVDRDNKGLTIGKHEDKLGIRASSTCPLIFDNCRVPKSAVVGEVGKGYKIAIGTLNAGRIGIGAQMLGLAQGCFDKTVPYLKERQQFGQRIWDFQAVQHQVADMAVQIEAARVLVYNAARMKECDVPYVKQAAIAKLYASNVATNVTSKCVELLGGVGFTRDFPVEKFYRDCKIGTIYEGTSNIQLNTIAKAVEQEY